MKTKTLAGICYALGVLCLIASGLIVGAVEAESIKEVLGTALAAAALLGARALVRIGFYLNHI